MLNDEDKALWEAYTKTVTPLKRISGMAKIKLFLSPKRWFLNKKEVALPAILDLHGMTLDEAYHIFNRFLQMHFAAQTGHITVITGRGKEGKGQLKKEFPLWLESAKIKEKIKSVQVKNEGAFEVCLRKNKC